MRALLVCVSVSHGNTRKVADAIAEVHDADVRTPEELEPDDVARYDLVGFGTGVFAAAPHPQLTAFIDRLAQVDGIPAFVFATSGFGRILNRPFTRPQPAQLRDKGFRVVGTFCCRGFNTWPPLRLVGGINEVDTDPGPTLR